MVGSAIADPAACGQPGACGDGNIGQVGIRGLETPAVVDADREHAGNRTGEGDNTRARSPDGRAAGDPVIDTPMPRIGAHGRKSADDGAGDGSRKGGTPASAGPHRGSAIRRRVHRRRADRKYEAEGSNKRHFALPATAGSTYPSRPLRARGPSRCVRVAPARERGRESARRQIRRQRPTHSAVARGVAGRLPVDRWGGTAWRGTHRHRRHWPGPWSHPGHAP